MTDEDRRETRGWFRSLDNEQRRYIWEQAEEEYGRFWRPELLRSRKWRIGLSALVLCAVVAWTANTMDVNRERAADSFTVQYLEGQAKNNPMLTSALHDAEREYESYLADQRAEMDANR